jgi:hypothetical protein
MYLPKNQYETGFFSNGELSNSSTTTSPTLALTLKPMMVNTTQAKNPMMALTFY